MKKLLYLFPFCLLLFESCDDDEESRSSEEQITTYLEENDLQAERSSTGLYYIIEEEGTDPKARATSTVTVSYKGYLTNGEVFDQNSGISFALNRVIPGWTEGMQLFGEGGKGILFVPSELGYGSSGIPGRIPGNSALIFEVEVLEII